MKARIAALMCAVVSGCGSPEARLPNPNTQEAQRGVARLLDASPQAYSLQVPEGEPTQCVLGKIGTEEVRTCKVCVIALYTQDSGHDLWRASLKREVFDVAFKRGQSFEQPDISPVSASSGVWVSVIPPQPHQFAPPEIKRTVQASLDIDYATAANILGLRHQRRFLSMQLFQEANGEVVRSQDVLTRLKQLPFARRVSLVGSCSAQPT